MVKASNKNKMNDDAINGGGRKIRKYKGVRMRSWGSWVSEIRAPNQKTRIWLGSYSTAEAAARAYDAALFILKGSNGTFNFPISTNPLHHCSNSSNELVIDTMSPKSIQRIAAAAAASKADHSAITTDCTISFCSQPSPPSSSSSSSSSSFSSSTVVSEEIVSSSVGLEDWAELGTFQSPKYADEMLNAWAICGYSQVEECEEDSADIRLWSF